MWTFKVDARAGDADNTCLFAMSLTQWLDGYDIRWYTNDIKGGKYKFE